MQGDQGFGLSQVFSTAQQHRLFSAPLTEQRQGLPQQQTPLVNRGLNRWIEITRRTIQTKRARITVISKIVNQPIRKQGLASASLNFPGLRHQGQKQVQ